MIKVVLRVSDKNMKEKYFKMYPLLNNVASDTFYFAFCNFVDRWPEWIILQGPIYV